MHDSYLLYDQKFKTNKGQSSLMNQNNFPCYLKIVLFAFILTSCQISASPDKVSDKFWQSVQQQNLDAIKKHSLKESIPENMDVKKLSGVQNYSFGKILIDGDNAEIETLVSVKNANKQNNISLTTKLLQHDGMWLVDFESTVSPLMINNEVAELMGGIEDLTEEFAKQVEGSVEEFKKKAIPEIKSKLEEAEQELKEKLPEIKGKIDEFLKELEKSIQEAFPEQKEDKQTVET